MNFRIILVWAERRPEKVRPCVGRGCRVEPALTVGCAADGEEDCLAGGLTFRYVLAGEVSRLVSNGIGDKAIPDLRTVFQVRPVERRAPLR